MGSKEAVDKLAALENRHPDSEEFRESTSATDGEKRTYKDGYYKGWEQALATIANYLHSNWATLERTIEVISSRVRDGRTAQSCIENMLDDNPNLSEGFQTFEKGFHAGLALGYSEWLSAIDEDVPESAALEEADGGLEHDSNNPVQATA